MTTYTITVDTNYQDLTAPAGNDTYNINGAKLTIDTDTRYCTNHDVTTGNLGGAVTISASLGGTLLIDGTKVRIIPYDSGSGNVPAIGTTISQGGVSAYLLGVWSAFNVAPTAAGSAMPSTGYVKVKNKTGGDFASGALTGIGANATGSDAVGWIEVVGVEATTITVPRLGKCEMKGEWFDVGVTNGVANQTLQMPASLANTYYPGVWIETGVGTGIYEFYPSAGTATTTRTDIAGKVVWISSQGLLRIGNSGAATNGYVPVSGCKIRVPNIITINVTSAAMGTNALPNATLTTRKDFTTTGGGAIDIDKANLAWWPSLAQAFSISITNTGILEQLQISELASPITLTNVGVGQTAAQAQFALLMTLCFAGGTITDCVWSRATMAASGAYVISMADCFGFDFINDTVRSCAARGNATTGSHTLTRVNYCTWTTLKIVGSGRVLLTTCSNMDFKTLSYCDPVSGSTVTTYAMYLFTITTNCYYIKVDGIDFWGFTNVHPYTALFQIIVGCCNIKLRNMGTAASPLSLGSANATGYVIVGAAGAGCQNIELKRIYLINTRSGLVSNIDNSHNQITYENVWTDAADALTFVALNTIIKGMMGTAPTAGQTSVYGDHWFDLFTSTTAGKIGILCNEKTTIEPSASSYVVNQGGAGFGFDSLGSVIMPNLNDQITWEVQYWIIGHTSFQNVAPTITGTNTANFTLEYQIDVGSGWNGTWKALSAANLSGEGTLPTAGIKLKIRATVNTANASNKLTLFTVATNANAASQQLQYPLDVVPITIQAVDKDNVPIENAQVYVERASDKSVIMNKDTDVNGYATTTYYYTGVVVNIRVRKSSSGATRYLPLSTFGTVGTGGFTLTAVLTEDIMAT